MNDFDYSEFQTGPGENILAQLSATAVELKQAQAEEARLEQELKDAKARVRHLSERALPELMDAAEMSEFSTKDGIKIKVDERIRASIPAANHVNAMSWLEEHGHENLIKRQVIVEFDRDEEAWANKFQRDCEKRKKPLNAKTKKAVHPQTLAKLIKDELEKGTDVPLDTFGAFRQRFTKISV